MSRVAHEQRISITFKHCASDKHWGGVESICLHKSRSALFSASRDSCIKRWDQDPRGRSFQCTASLSSHCGWVTALALFDAKPHGLLISGSNDTTIKLWNPESTGRSLHTITKHSDYVLQLATAESVAQFASAGLRGDVHIWDAEVCHSIVTAGGAPDSRAAEAGGGYTEFGSIYAMACTPDMHTVCFSGADGAISIHDSRADRRVGLLRGHRDSVKAVRISADGRRIVSGSSDRTMRVWDVGMQACSSAFEMHGDSVWALSSDERCSVVVSGGRDKQVFLTDVATERTELVATADAPVLDVQADWDSKLVWVGTTMSDITAWSFQDLDEPAQPIFCHDVAAASGEQGRVSNSRPRLPAYEALCAQPLVRLRGIPPLVRHAVFEDKRHILTLDAAGTVRLWDVVFCENVNVYPAGTDFEALYKQLFLQKLDAVPAWFTSDVQLGVITLHLANPQAFTAELYAHALGINCNDDSFKLNYGHEILKSVLVVWQLKCEGRSITDFAENGTRMPFDLLYSQSVRPRISCRPLDSTSPWCLDMRDFTGHEHEHKMLPKWVLDAVTKAHFAVPPSNAKLAFSLNPSRHSDLPLLERTRLTAPIILEVRKVVHYVQERLREQNIDVTVAEISFDSNENLRERMTAHPPLLQITCNGKLIPFNMTLNTVKRYLCTGRADEDIPLEYSCVDPLNLAPLPKIVPSNH